MDENEKDVALPGPHRRNVLRGIGLSVGVAGVAAFGAAAQAANLEQSDAPGLGALGAKLARLPRRRDFKTVPMILTSPDQWDSAALNEVIGYRAGPKQVWDNTDLAGPWLNLMRNSMNAQIWSWKHPNYLSVSATHGAAHLALYDQSMWDKYQIAGFTGGKFASNTLLEVPTAAQADPARFNAPNGPFSPSANSITVLQQRGVVFLACHNAIWEFSAALLKKGNNPDKLSHEALAAELTNHLIPGAVVTPGVVGTILQLQLAGFHYAASA
nr:transcriptional initiation protein Tat [uncultured Acidocella sp.]